MNYRLVGWSKSLFILVSLGVAGAAVVNCGGDDASPGNPGGAGGSSGSGGSGGSGGAVDAGSGIDSSARGGDSSATGGDARADTALADTGRPDGSRDTSPPTEAAVATCNAALSDADSPCLADCFCGTCPALAVQCLTDPGCVAITECALRTQCAAVSVLACFDSETCGPAITANSTSLPTALALGNDPCVPTCVARCMVLPDAASGDGNPTGDAPGEADDGGSE